MPSQAQIDLMGKTGVYTPNAKTIRRAPRVDPLVRDSKRRLAKTSAGKLAKLFAERTRWSRKRTIAENKLRRVQFQIDALANANAAKLAGTEWEGAQ